MQNLLSYLNDSLLFQNFLEVINKSYEKGITDEFILPTSLSCAKPLQKMDSLLFFNFTETIDSYSYVVGDNVFLFDTIIFSLLNITFLLLFKKLP